MAFKQDCGQWRFDNQTGKRPFHPVDGKCPQRHQQKRLFQEQEIPELRRCCFYFIRRDPQCFRKRYHQLREILQEAQPERDGRCNLRTEHHQEYFHGNSQGFPQRCRGDLRPGCSRDQGTSVIFLLRLEDPVIPRTCQLQL